MIPKRLSPKFKVYSFIKVLWIVSLNRNVEYWAISHLDWTHWRDFQSPNQLKASVKGAIFVKNVDNKMTKDGIYKTKTDKMPRQMYYCHEGQHRFSEWHEKRCCEQRRRLLRKEVYFIILQPYFNQIWQSDPRFYQITILSGLLIYGIGWLDFEIKLQSILTIIGTALLTQLVCTYWFKLPRFDVRSPLISALSLCLLLRTDYLWLMSFTAILTISSKFILRWNNKHIFNPTNFGLVMMMLLTEQVWVSPGQWDNAAFFGFLLACMGGLVINRAARSDVTYAFLMFYLTILLGRAWWLGDPLTIPLHQLENGALLLFAFFMISDPKTTPDSRVGRILFAFLVATGAGLIHFWLYRTNGLLWALAGFAWLVPLIDWLLPSKRYQWTMPKDNIPLDSVDKPRSFP